MREVDKKHFVNKMVAHSLKKCNKNSREIVKELGEHIYPEEYDTMKEVGFVIMEVES